jgi:uncharacterized protein (DUF58 family)
VARLIPLTSEGLIWLVAVAALLVTGLLKGINLITLLSCLMLAFIGLNFWLAGRQLRGLRAKRLMVEPIFAGTPFLMVLRVSHTHAGRKSGLALLDEGPQHRVTWFLDHLPASREAVAERELILPRRGRYAWGTLSGVSAFPLGLAVRARTILPGEELIVLPAVGRLHRGRLRRFLDLASPTLGQKQAHPRRHPASQNEFHGLRLFRSGDSPRLIHWRTSARRGELMVREFEDAPTDNLVLIVDPFLPADGAGQALLETAIGLAATICWEWCRQKGDYLVLVVAGSQPLVLSGLTSQELAIRMLECLAVEEGASHRDDEAVAAALANAHLPVGPVLLVTTGDVGLAAVIRQACHRPVASVSVAETAFQDFYEKKETGART